MDSDKARANTSKKRCRTPEAARAAGSLEVAVARALEVEGDTCNTGVATIPR